MHENDCDLQLCRTLYFQSIIACGEYCKMCTIYFIYFSNILVYFLYSIFLCFLPMWRINVFNIGYQEAQLSLKNRAKLHSFTIQKSSAKCIKDIRFCLVVQLCVYSDFRCCFRRLIQFISNPSLFLHFVMLIQELISRIDSRTLRPVNALGLVFSNNIQHGISDIRHY